MGGPNPGASTMNKGLEITRGKTKALFESPDQLDVAVMKSMDSITAGDGARRNVIEGKGRLAAQTTARVFRLLNLCGFPTHYISGGEDDDENEILVRRCQMIPLEVVVRGVAAGSYVKRKGMARGTLLLPRVLRILHQRRCQPRSADRARRDRSRAASRIRASLRRWARIARMVVRSAGACLAPPRRAPNRSEDRVWTIAERRRKRLARNRGRRR